ncbi:MAG: hypothetical protein SFV51_03625, partial [Bryobacteraceae bacterium]|nr:hypothetical protein [Bryobacteraceae bacterium]
LGEKRAIPLIRSVLHDKSLRDNVRRYAARALGQIDAEGNKQELLRAFDESAEPALWPLRLDIAKALIRVKDRSVVNKLESWSRGERSSVARRKFEEVVAEMKRQLPPL